MVTRPHRPGIEQVLAVICLALAVLTVVVPDWVEVGFRIDPDAGNGTLERFVVIGLGILSVVRLLVGRLRARSGSRRLEACPSGP